MERLMLVMILIWFLSGIFSLVSSKFGLKSDRTILSCGLIGYCGSVPADPEKIKMLMMYNEERGGDSTGWAINNNIVKDTEKVPKFLTKNKLVVSANQENFTIVAHARKASVGGKYDKELAHPFGVYNAGSDKKKYDLILAMNGTLTNIELLAKEFKEEFRSTVNSDTQILARVISRLGVENAEEVLRLYDGSATLLYYNPFMPNTLIVYKDPERPLYCWNQTDEQMYISSVREGLLALGADDDKVLHFLGNKIVNIENGIIGNVKEIKRIPLKPVATFPKHSECGYHRRSPHYLSEYEVGNNSILVTAKTKKSISLLGRVDDTKSHSSKAGKVYTINERYYFNGHPMHGETYITLTGKQKSKIEAEKCKDTKDYANQFFFVNGHMCNTEKDFLEIESKCKGKSGKFDLEKFKNTQISIFVENFSYPVVTICDGQEVWVVPDKYITLLPRVGSITKIKPFLSEEEFSLIRTKNWTTISTKLVCEIGEVVKANELFLNPLSLPELKNTEDETEAFLIKKLKVADEECSSADYYYSQLRKNLWRRNPNQELREYYFDFLLRTCLKYEVINEKTFDDMKDQAIMTIYSGKDFLHSLREIIEHLKKKVKDVVEQKSVTEQLNQFSTTEKIKLLEKDSSVITEADIVKSVLDCNIYMKSNGFDNEIYSAEKDSVVDLMHDWVKNTADDKEMFNFYEGVLLCMNNCTQITDNELLYALETNLTDLGAKVEECYNKWRDYIKNNDDDKEHGKKIEGNDDSVQDCDTKQMEEVEKIKEPEELTPEYYYNEFQSEINELVESMKETNERLSKLENGSKNKALLDLEFNFTEIIEYSEIKLVKK